MNPKSLTWLAFVFGFLVVAIIIKRLAPRKELFQQEAQSLQIQLHPDAIDRIALKKGTESTGIEFQKSDGIWRLPALWNTRTDADRVQQLLNHVVALSGEMRGNSETLFDDFGISDAKALHITLSESNREALQLVVGTKSAGWGQMFVRKAKTPLVFLCRSRILQDLNIYGDINTAPLSAETWVDVKLFAFSPDAIQRTEVKESAGEWRELGSGLPFERDDAQVRSYLQTLLSLKASGVVDPKGTSYGFENPIWQLRLSKKEGDPIVLTIGGVKSSSTEDHYLRLSTDEEVYYAGRYILEQLQIDGSRLIRQDPLKAGAAAWQDLNVDTPAKRVSVSLKDAHWPGLDNYLQSLKAFRVFQVDHLPAQQDHAPATPYRVELSNDQHQEPVSVACEAPGSSAASDVLCLNQQRGARFLITHATFQSLFEQLDRLEKPQPAQTPPSHTSTMTPPSTPSNTTQSAAPIQPHKEPHSAQHSH